MLFCGEFVTRSPRTIGDRNSATRCWRGVGSRALEERTWNYLHRLVSRKLAHAEEGRDLAQCALLVALIAGALSRRGGRLSTAAGTDMSTIFTQIAARLVAPLVGGQRRVEPTMGAADGSAPSRARLWARADDNAVRRSRSGRLAPATEWDLLEYGLLAALIAVVAVARHHEALGDAISTDDLAEQ